VRILEVDRQAKYALVELARRGQVLDEQRDGVIGFGQVTGHLVVASSVP
jgi:hypothetical protein